MRLLAISGSLRRCSYTTALLDAAAAEVRLAGVPPYAGTRAQCRPRWARSERSLRGRTPS